MNKNSNVPKICLEFPGHQRVKGPDITCFVIYLDFLFNNHSQTKHEESLNHGQDTFAFVNAKACDQELSDCFVE